MEGRCCGETSRKRVLFKVSCKAIGESSIGISTEQGYVMITNTGEIESFFKNGEPEYYHPWKLIKVMLDCGYAPKNYI